MAVARSLNDIAVFGDWVKPRETGPSPYRALVTRVGGDGNEMAGILLPDIAVPLATYTGWNLYKAPFTEGALCDRDGSYLPLARTQSERQSKGDPRASLQERYGSHAEYLRRLNAAVAALVKDRLLLAEDAERTLKAAQAAAVAELFER